MVVWGDGTIISAVMLGALSPRPNKKGEDMIRTIEVSIDPNDDTYCGNCSKRTPYVCSLFGNVTFVTGPEGEHAFMRHPDCVSAEWQYDAEIVNIKDVASEIKAVFGNEGAYSLTIEEIVKKLVEHIKTIGTYFRV
jgi:hypothetical protein